MKKDKILNVIKQESKKKSGFKLSVILNCKHAF